MRVKINKVLPVRQVNSGKKLQAFVVGNEQYTQSASKMDEKNFTGYPLYLQLICTLPDANVDYDYAKFNIVVESSDYKEMIQRKSERFDDIKKGQNRRDFVFSFLPLKKGLYTIKIETAYRPRYFSNGAQQSDEKRQSMQTSIKFDDPFEIGQFFVTEDKANSLTFPLIIQHTIQSKLPEIDLPISINFQSEMFQWKFINDKNDFSLKLNQAYYTVLSVKPHSLKKFLLDKPQTIGQMTIKYGQKGELRKKINFRVGDKYMFFKGLTLQKTIPKKDIVEVPIRFEKIYGANFGLGDFSIVINENLMQGIKVVKTSKSKINLDNNRYEDVVFSIICLKSGFYHVKGLTLNTNDNRVVNFVNEITLFVQNELEIKTDVFENTSVVMPVEEESLI